MIHFLFLGDMRPIQTYIGTYVAPRDAVVGESARNVAMVRLKVWQPLPLPYKAHKFARSYEGSWGKTHNSCEEDIPDKAPPTMLHEHTLVTLPDGAFAVLDTQ